MSLSFPNRSRSFDEARNGVRFIGYDGMFEVAFIVEAAALVSPGPTEASESDCLAAFDATRSSVLDVAREVYSHARQNVCYLTAADFR